MRILVLHNRYQLAGGEDTVVTAEKELLTANGNEVRLLSVASDNVRGLGAKIRTAFRVAYSRKAFHLVAEEVASFQPDIVHVHNFFPLLTPSVYDACNDKGIPVIQTLHNFRTICPGALLMRAGKICEECLFGSPYRAGLHRCYRNSLIGSLAVARMVDYHRKHGTWLKNVDRFIALTEFAKTRFVTAGFPAEKIDVKPNFTRDVETLSDSGTRAGALFVGRLSPEKGIGTLMKAWRLLAVPLLVVGDGPLQEVVGTPRIGKLAFIGRRSVDDVAAEMEKASFLVMPSECYETFGLVIIEAFAHSLPVIASRLGSMAKIVVDGVTGLHFEAGNADDLAAKVRWATEHPEEMRVMGDNARKEYVRKYTPEVNYCQLMSIYEEAIKNKEKGGRHH
jgi:glycosyltransferase involved in cell wall biosynthesis